MAVAFVDSSHTPFDPVSASSFDITLPAGIDAGDIILIFAPSQEGTDPGPPTTPAGFTQEFTFPGSGFIPEMTGLIRVADGTEDEDVITLDFGASSLECHPVCVVLSGADGTTPVDVTPVVAGGTIPANPDPAQLETVTDGCKILLIAAGNDSPMTVPTVSTGYSILFDDQQSDDRAIFIAELDQATAGIENPDAWSWPVDNFAVVTMAIRPAPAAGDTVASLDLAEETDEAFDVGTELEGPIRAVLDVAEETDTAEDALAFTVDVDAPQFPDTTLDMRVELAFEPTDEPLDLEWIDVSDRLLAQSTSIRRGRADESARPQPSTMTLTLDNNDGALMPGNPLSPWYPNVRRGLPMRVSIPGDTPALRVPGVDGSGASTPDHPDFAFAGPLDVRMRIHPERWSIGMDFREAGNRDNLRRQTLITKGDVSTGQLSWAWQLATAGFPALTISGDGNSGSTFIPFDLITALRPVWIGVTWESLTENQRVVTYRFDGDIPPTDITQWTVVDSSLFGPTALPIFPGTDPIELGMQAGRASFRGRILAAQIRDGINGTLVANPDFTQQLTGVRKFTDSVGKEWTVSGRAEIDTLRPRFVGTVDQIIPTWPAGDNNASGQARPSEARAELTASGLLRRLSQGAKPVRSSIFRNVTSARYRDDVIGYWPCEDLAGAGQLASGIEDDNPILVQGELDTGSDSGLAASAALPVVQSGKAISWRVDVPASEVTDQWAVEMVFRLPTPPLNADDELQLLEIESLGTVARTVLTVDEDTIRIRLFDANGLELDNRLVAVGPEIFSGFVQLIVRLRQVGGSVEWLWTTNNLDIGLGGGFSDLIPGVAGPVVGLSSNVVGPEDGFTFGHIVVHTARLPGDWQVGADSAWVGESAAHRFWRLCAEEGIPAEVVGDQSVFESTFGDIGITEAMGAQRQQTLLQLLQECVDTDLGVLISRRGAPGLVYRTRQTLERQTPALRLSGARNEISRPLTPRLDDQRLRNDVTVTSEGGSSARATDPASIAREGLYDVDETIVGVGGVFGQQEVLDRQPGLRLAVRSQNLHQAGWRLALGTVDALRIPTVTIDFRAVPGLIEAFQSLELGDRILLDDLPIQLPADTVELILEASDERLSNTSWIPVLTCSPGAPYLVGILDDDELDVDLQRLGGEDPELVADIAAGDGTLELDTTFWATDPAAYPMLITVGGELIRAMSANAGDETTTLLGLERAVNSVAKAHAAGAVVSVADPFLLSLGLAGHPIT